MERFYPQFEDFLNEAGPAPTAEDKFAQIRPQGEATPRSNKIEDYAYVYAKDGTKIDMGHLKREMESAKTAIVSQSPLFAPYVHRFTPIYTWLVPTMATDGTRLFVNPMFANKLTWEQKIFVIIHEIMHCVLLHMQRIKGRNPKIFNYAGDYEINAIIIDTLSDFNEAFLKALGGLYDPQFLNLPVETIYEQIKKDPKFQKPPQNPNSKGNQGSSKGEGGPPDQGDPGEGGEGEGEGEGGEGEGDGQPGKPGKGKGKPGKPGEKPIGGAGESGEDEIYKQMEDEDPAGTGGVMTEDQGKKLAKKSGYGEDESGPDENATDKWRVEGAKMLERAEKSSGKAGQGKGSALIKALYRLHKGDVNWQNLFRRYVATALSPEVYQRLGNKKHLGKEFLRYGEKHKMDAIENIVVMVDVSGSMGKEALEKILNEINQIIFSKKINKITVAFFDDGVDDKSVQTIKRMGKPYIPKNVSGGGGTSFQKPLDWIHEHLKDRVSLCIYFTDGFAPMPKKPPFWNKFIWVIYDNPQFKQPFGKQISVN
jgi:predicted metal-dependent peptidase